MFNERELTEKSNKLKIQTLRKLSQDYQARNIVAEFIKDYPYDRINFDIHDAEDMFNALIKEFENEK